MYLMGFINSFPYLKFLAIAPAPFHSVPFCFKIPSSQVCWGQRRTHRLHKSHLWGSKYCTKYICMCVAWLGCCLKDRLAQCMDKTMLNIQYM